MTPAQAAALVAVRGYALTLDEAQRIEPLLDPDNRNDTQIAAILSEGRTKFGEVRRMEIGFVGAYPGGPVQGDAVLAKLEAHAESQAPTARIVARALRAMRTEPGLNLGDPALHAMLNLLVPDPLTQAEVDSIVSMGRVPHPVSTSDLSRALNIAEGRMVL